jgi:hypothetical protein
MRTREHTFRHSLVSPLDVVPPALEFFEKHKIVSRFELDKWLDRMVTPVLSTWSSALGCSEIPYRDLDIAVRHCHFTVLFRGSYH